MKPPDRTAGPTNCTREPGQCQEKDLRIIRKDEPLDEYVFDALAAGAYVLTECEREVLREVARGLSNAEIAARLHVAETTVPR